MLLSMIDRCLDASARRSGGPDFLGIGAQRTATSWLWRSLRLHPELWLPPQKELHYFDRSLSYPSANHLSAMSPLRRVFGRDPEWRQAFVENARHALRDLSLAVCRFKQRGWRAHAGRNGDQTPKAAWQDFVWRVRYVRGPYDDDWYRSLFDPAGSRLAGEITPSYSILDLADVRRIGALFPELKVIVLLRNPVDRDWSQVRFNWSNRRFLKIDDVDAVIGLLDSRGVSMRSDYLRMLDAWASCFAAHQIHIALYDDVVADPRATLESMLRFLGVNPALHPTPGAGERINAATERAAPLVIRRHLATKHLADVRVLNERLGGRAATWVADLERILELPSGCA